MGAALKPKRGFWWALDDLLSGEAPLAEWQGMMGEEFLVGREYLCPTGRVGDRHPCKAKLSCGCHHRVVKLGQDKFAGACSCPEADCPSFDLSLDAVVLHGVDEFLLGDAIRRGFGFEQGRMKLHEIGMAGWWEVVGVLKPDEHLAVFIVSLDENELLWQMDSLLRCQMEHGVIMTPTPRLHSERILEKARRNGLALLGLSEYLVVEPGLEMQLVRTALPALEGIGGSRRRRNESAAVLREIHKEIAAVRTEFHDVKRVKKGLEEMVAQGYFGFLKTVDARSFKILCTIISAGDVAKASVHLEMADSTLRDELRKWKRRGPAFRKMLDLVRWRKGRGHVEFKSLDDAVILEKASSTNYPALISEVLDQLLSMTEGNWEDTCHELSELLRDHDPG